MSATACALLRHDIRPRWVGDLLAAWCHTCQPGHLLIPEPAFPLGSQGGMAAERSDGPRVPAIAEPPPRA